MDEKNCMPYRVIHEQSNYAKENLLKRVRIDAETLSAMAILKWCNGLMVRDVGDDRFENIKPADIIMTANGKNVHLLADLDNLTGDVELCLYPAPIHLLPTVFDRLIDDAYNSSTDAANPTRRRLTIHLNRDDVVQELRRDGDWALVRKIGDLSQVGHVPIGRLARVALTSPFAVNVLVLVGAIGSGRRTLKRMLLRTAPHLFTTVVPVTSRAPSPNEVKNRDYAFLRKEEILAKIRNNEMVEYGYFNHQLYGTTIESVRQSMREGRLVVIDGSPNCLDVLCGADRDEFKPFVVHITPPPLDEFVHLESLKEASRSLTTLEMITRDSESIAQLCRGRIDVTLVNRNVDVTFKRLIEALEGVQI
ncbi:unnamed protein product [Caenorhabditis bovis]|uniref:Guanylate kinase-like domain-containing protein n=1 Tax=Caenorhabditis bovis TaxID=2654633 RepID=A0A8S1F5J1_9PELO|nr:unnamed protein product [Caenorhabditis bovis]